MSKSRRGDRCRHRTTCAGRRRVTLFVLALAGLLCGSACGGSGILEWSELAPLPDAHGVAGPFAGVSSDALIVAGGANFPEGPPWEGHPKHWHDAAYVLTAPDGAWKQAGKLPRPLAYGVSVTWKDGVVCAGGGDADRHYADAFLLRWTGEKLETQALPALPKPCAFGAGVLVEDTVYLAGGQESPKAGAALKNFWALDLSRPAAERRWRQLDPWPGPARILPVMAAQQGDVFLVSGAELYRAADGAVTRRFLTDGYRYNPGEKRWQKIADAPRPLVAAPNPAVALGHAHLLFLSGDDGAHFFQASELKDRHPGFPADLLVYHTIGDTWTRAGEFPREMPDEAGPYRNAGTWAPVTTTVTPWRGAYIIPSGEARPGVRTPKVMCARPAALERTFGWLNWTVLGTYLAALVGMGFYFAKREKSTDDFFLAGRRIPWWAAGLSIFGTQLSAITYLAMPARAFATDWVLLLLNVGILAVTPFVVYIYLPLFRRLDVTTAYEYLEKRFHVSVRLFGSFSFIAFQLGRMGIVVLLPALALSAVTGINVYICIALMGVLSTIYTVLGGIEAVIWTDVLQAVVLIGGALAALGIIVATLDGGWRELVAVGAADGKFNLVQLDWDWAGDALAVVILGALFTNALVPYTTDQAVIQRYLTTPTEKQAAKAIWTNGLLAVFAGVLFLMVGTGLFVFYKLNPGRLAPLEKADQIFALFIAREMPAGLAGLVIAGVFAAAMSSLDSSMHSIATALTTDFVRRFRPTLGEETYLAWARGMTVVLGVAGTAAAMLMARLEIKYLWDFFLGIMGLLGGTLAGLFVLGVFTQRVRTLHAWLGATASVAVLLVVKLATNLSGLLYGAIGVATCLTVAALAARVLPTSTTLPPGLTIHTLRKPNCRDCNTPTTQDRT